MKIQGAWHKRLYNRTIDKHMKSKLLIPALLLISSTALAQSPQKHPFTFEDMMKLKRVGAPVPSPDGKWVVFDCVDVDLEANTRISHLWIVPASGGESRRLNPTPNHEERPRFSPDGKRLIWTSKATDPTQIWMCDFDSERGALVGKPHQVTNISTGADGGIWSPDGKNIVFVSAVYPDCKDDACNKQRDEELKKSKVKAKIFSRLFYRHWSAFTEFKRSHLFVLSCRGACVGRRRDRRTTRSPQAATTAATISRRAITMCRRSISAARTCMRFRPTARKSLTRATSTRSKRPARTTKFSSCRSAAARAKKISTSPGADTTPLYSPDGKYLAWRSQARAGFEADKWRLFVQDRQSGKTRDLTEKFDRSVGSFAWQPDSRR